VITGTADHGTTCIGNPATSITYTITNVGGAEAQGVAVNSDNPEFAVSSLSSTTIPTDGTATFTVYVYSHKQLPIQGQLH
jgi:subtilase family serine protease